MTGSVSIRHDSGNTTYIAFDYLGSPTATTTSSGQEDATFAYDPYGNPRGNTEPLAGIIGYAGGIEDPSGLVKFGARYYDPTTGRFTQMDPTGQETNPYAYAHNNPVSYADPTGTSAWGVLGQIFNTASAVSALTSLGDVITESDDAEQRKLAAELATNFGVAQICSAAIAVSFALTPGGAFLTALGCSALGYLTSQGVR